MNFLIGELSSLYLFMMFNSLDVLTREGGLALSGVFTSEGRGFDVYV